MPPPGPTGYAEQVIRPPGPWERCSAVDFSGGLRPPTTTTLFLDVQNAFFGFSERIFFFDFRVDFFGIRGRFLIVILGSKTTKH